MARAGRERRPDIEAGATVRAARLRFRSAPRAEASLHGDVDATVEVERRNLPAEVEPGVTYRDAQVRAHVEARITE